MLKNKTMVNKKKLGLFCIIIIIFLLFIVNGMACSNDRVDNYCFLDGYFDTILEPLVFVILSLFAASVFIFFISDRTFKKWLKFAAIWFLVDVIWIIKSPVISHYEFDIIPSTKESVSIWMGSLFVIISLVMFIILTIKERKFQK